MLLKMRKAFVRQTIVDNVLDTFVHYSGSIYVLGGVQVVDK